MLIECDDMELSSLLSQPPMPNYIDFTRRQKGETSKNWVQNRTAIFLVKAKIVADSGDAASTADDVASRISDRLPVGLIEVAAIEQPPVAGVLATFRSRSFLLSGRKLP